LCHRPAAFHSRTSKPVMNAAWRIFDKYGGHRISPLRVPKRYHYTIYGCRMQ
jgi:hypothetical protein